MKIRAIYTIFAGSAALFISACASNAYLSPESRATGILSRETVQRHSSGEALEFSRARLITQNDEAFLAKLDAVRGAKSSIDAAYYIFSDDITSSAVANELVIAANRGVRVRLLVDYSSVYKDLDLFSMLEAEGNKGSGNLEVRLYNRPTRNIVMDAAYMTLGCGDVDTSAGASCSDSKMNAIASAFDAETIDGRPASELGISNMDFGSSGMFLSGIYAKQPTLMAFAMLHGKEIALPKPGAVSGGVSAEDISNLVKLAKIYWKARSGGPFERLVAKIQLAVVSVIYGDQLDPLYEAVAQRLPIARRNLSASVRDWEYITDYMHQKLLLVDNSSIQLGGRNVEDTYHLTPAQTESGLVFMDTDLQADLTSGGASVQAAFDRLWDLKSMVATIGEVRRHAPNDFAMNLDALEGAAESCKRLGGLEEEECLSQEFRTHATTLSAREWIRYDAMKERAREFWAQYRPGMDRHASSTLAVDPGAELFYIENIPFSGGPDVPLNARSYGAKNGAEAATGKRIHSILLARLESVCREATAQSPLRVVINNAYFFPPSNVIDAFASMLDGRLDCRHVRVTILTNSRRSSDLAITNLFARHIAFAFNDYIRSIRDPDRGATFEYFEVQGSDGNLHHSLHSKVWLIGNDVLVGSANADVRSYMMDANNAMLIRQAPELVKRYVSRFDLLLADTKMSTNVSKYYSQTLRESVIEEDRQAFRSVLSSMGVDSKLSAEQINTAEDQFVSVLELIYSLTRDGLEGRLDSEEKRARFDRLFKLI